MKKKCEIFLFTETPLQTFRNVSQEFLTKRCRFELPTGGKGI
jgi:hypothetical protein